MYCKNCGSTVDNNAAVCVQCGFAVGTGNSYCPNCGQTSSPGAAVCTKCGATLNGTPNSAAKSKLVAGLLGILLGCYGIHNFYLGYTKKGLTQLLICILGLCFFVGPLVSFIWGVVEGIQILTGTINVDAKGIPLKD